MPNTQDSSNAPQGQSSADTAENVAQRPSVPPRRLPTEFITPPFSSPAAKANWATVIFIILGIVTLISISATTHQISLIRALMGGQDVSNEQLLTSDTLLAFIGAIYLATFVVTAIAFLIWLHTASKNLAALGTDHQLYTPFQAILWWFIPIVMLIVPYLVVREIWEGSYPTIAKHQLPGLLGPWWFTWLASGFATLAASFLSSANDPSLTQLWFQNIVSIGSDALSLISLVIVTIIVRRITSNQVLKHN